MEWVSTDELMRALDAPAARIRSDAALRVCKRAHEGLLRARAQTFFKDGERLDGCELPKEFWWAEGGAALTQDWTAGDFSTGDPANHPSGPTAWMAAGISSREWRAYGVEWHKQDAEGMGARFAMTEENTPSNRGQGGLKPDAARWQAFYFAVIELAKEGRLTREHFSSRAALSEEVLTLMGTGAFSPDHVKSIVSQIFAKFIGD